MKLAFPLVASLLLAFLSATNARAQDSARHPSFLIGAIGGYELVAYNTNAFPVLNSRPWWIMADNGQGSGFYAGLSAEHNLIIPKNLYYLVEFEFDSKPANFSFVNRAPGDTEVALWTELSYYNVNLGLKYSAADSLPHGLGIELCVSIGILNTADLWNSISTSSGVTETEERIVDAQRLRFALRPELTYDFPLDENWVVTASLGDDVPLSQVDPALNWRASALFAGAAVRYAVW